MAEMVKTHALLIGIDHYFPNTIGFGHLHGCVSDIALVEKFLRQRLGLADKDIIRLTSTHSLNATPEESSTRLATYQNMVNGFKEVINKANKGDQVYIHYSGHGGRARTLFPSLKPNGIDEGLVPSDIGTPGGQYLRDVELIYLLRSMVDKGLLVTVVLDSCHSGGMPRRGISSIRGLPHNRPDEQVRPFTELITNMNALMEPWREAAMQVTRNATEVPFGLPEPHGYVLLAACRQDQFAHEGEFEPGAVHGALTYYVVSTLSQMPANMTYRLLHYRVQPKVMARFRDQSPQIYGEADREIFGITVQDLANSAFVREYDIQKHEVLIDAGLAQGVGSAAEFSIFPLGTRSEGHADGNAIATARVFHVSVGESWAKLENPPKQAIEIGAPAVLIHPGSNMIVRTVSFIRDKNGTQQNALEIEQELIASLENSAFLGYTENLLKSHFQVLWKEGGIFEIFDSGGSLLPGIGTLPSDKSSIKEVVRRLTHLAKYMNVLDLENSDRHSSLAGKIQFEIVSIVSSHVDGKSPADNRPPTHGELPIANNGDRVTIRVRNNSSKTLYFSILCLQLDWNIVRLVPRENDAAPSYVLEANTEEPFSWRFGLPDGYTDGTDILKVIASPQEIDLWTLLLSVDESAPIAKRSGRGEPNALEILFMQLTQDRPKAIIRNALSDDPIQEWVTEQIYLRIES